MPDPAAPPSPNLFFETINAFQRTGALKAAIDLGVFTTIGGTPSTAAEIASRCECPERGIRILSDSLTIFGFLVKQDGRYSLTPDAAAFLDRNSRTYIGGAAEFFLSPGIVEGFSDLASTNGKVEPVEELPESPGGRPVAAQVNEVPVVSETIFAAVLAHGRNHDAVF